MSFLISTQSELLKTKRTASFWLSIFGAAFIPTIFFIVFVSNPQEAASIQKEPWAKFFKTGFEILSFFLLPMYIILISTLIPQIEFRNNTWKQVFASPQSLGNIFFSKFVTIQIMIIATFLLFNLFMIISAIVADLFNPILTFRENNIDVNLLLRYNFKIYLATLGISAIQYALSFRFKGFIIPVGIGLALVIAGFIAMNVHWKHIYKYPYCLPIISVDMLKKTDRPFIENHEWNSIGYFVSFLAIGFLDMKFRKEKG